MAHAEVGRVTLSVTVRGVAVAGPAGRPGVNAEEGRLVAGSVSLWIREGERSYPLRSPPTLSRLRREMSQTSPGVWGKKERGGHLTKTAEAQGALPPLPQPPAPTRAQRLESPPRGRSQAVNAPSRPVLPTGPSPPPHLKTRERLHRGLDDLLGRPLGRGPGEGRGRANLVPSLLRPCHSSGRRGRAARTPKQSGSRAA